MNAVRLSVPRVGSGADLDASTAATIAASASGVRQRVSGSKRALVQQSTGALR